jgi:hypothetical protein
METIKSTVKEVLYAIIPVTVFVIILQFTVIHMEIATFVQFLIGVAMVGIGLILFLVGVHTGLLPLGELIGSTLPKTGKVWLVLLFGFLLGFVVTVAEPDVRVLATQVDYVSEGSISKNLLIYAVSLGVAFFVALALLRIILGFSIGYVLVIGYALVFLLAAFTPPQFVPVAFDSGGVTTGPMTVPFILALGVGLTSVLYGKSASSDGFGLVALASIGPILAVLLLGVIYG